MTLINEELFYNFLIELFFKEQFNQSYVKQYYDILNNLSLYNECDKNKILSFHYYLKHAKFYIPQELSLCVTDYCQLKCKHCYFGEYERGNSLTIEQVKYINNKFLSLRDYFENNGFTHIHEDTPCYGILGGEPLLNKDLSKILLFLLSYTNSIKLDSNGILYDKEIVDILDNSINPSTYQISIDGNEYWHNYNRGVGTYKQSLSTITKIRNASKNINVTAAFNAHSKNYKSIEEMVINLIDAGVNGIIFNRYIPTNNELSCLSQNEFLEYKQIISEIKEKYQNTIFVKTKHINFNKTCLGSLLRQVCYTNGDRFVCTRYQIKTGNWFTDNISTLAKNALYYHMKTQSLPTECFLCANKHSCLGGMRCMNYTYNNSLLEKDIHCLI